MEETNTTMNSSSPQQSPSPPSRYDLLREHAVTLARADGTPAEVSLRTAILDADQYTDLITPLPTMIPALLRQMLLPIVMDALGPMDTDQWLERFERTSFSDDDRATFEGYFNAHRDCFDLFGQRPFAQTPGLEAATGEVKPVSILLPHIATGNNVPLRTAYTDAAGPRLSPAEAFWALVHCLCWDTAALKTGAANDPKVTGGTTKGNHTGPLGQLGVVVPLGRNLYHTLLLNLLTFRHRDQQDRPQWSRPDAPGPCWEQREPEGMLDLFTWPSRRIRLVAEVAHGGTVVTGAVCTAGDRLSRTPEWEPHTLRRKAKDSQRGSEYAPMRHRSGKAAWQSLDALLALARGSDSDDSPVLTSELLDRFGGLVGAGEIAGDYPLRIAVFGFEYGAQSATVANAVLDQIPLPVASLAAESTETRRWLLESASQADQLRLALDRYQNDLRLARRAAPLPWDQGSHAGAELIAALDLPARRLLAGFQACADDRGRLKDGMCAWERIVWEASERIAERLAAALPPGALITVKSQSPAKTTSPEHQAKRKLDAARAKVLPREAARRRETASRTGAAAA